MIAVDVVSPAEPRLHVAVACEKYRRGLYYKFYIKLVVPSKLKIFFLYCPHIKKEYLKGYKKPKTEGPATVNPM